MNAFRITTLFDLVCQLLHGVLHRKAAHKWQRGWEGLRCWVKAQYCFALSRLDETHLKTWNFRSFGKGIYPYLDNGLIGEDNTYTMLLRLAFAYLSRLCFTLFLPCIHMIDYTEHT